MAPKYTEEFQQSLDHVLKLDPSLRSIVDSYTFHTFLAPKPENLSSFQYLVRNILSQQVSGAAGNAIMKRFLELCASPEEEFPSPETLLKFSVEQLRTAGLSMRKAEYVRGLAEAYIKDELSDEILKSLDDDEVVDKIVSVRGLGPWTAQMFLIFYLHRPNVWSVGDVGVQRGVRRYLKERPHILKELQTQSFEAPPSPGKSKKAKAKTPIPADLQHMDALAARFAPHRTAFQMILWKLSDIQMNTIEAREAVDQAIHESKKRKAPSAATSKRKKNDAKATASQDAEAV